MGLTNSELGGIIHGDVLHGGQGAAAGARCGDANVAHVANVKNANAAANGFMFGDQAASGRVFDRHIPAAEIHHFAPKRRWMAFRGVLRELGYDGRIDGRLQNSAEIDT